MRTSPTVFSSLSLGVGFGFDTVVAQEHMRLWTGIPLSRDADTVTSLFFPPTSLKAHRPYLIGSVMSPYGLFSQIAQEWGDD